MHLWDNEGNDNIARKPLSVRFILKLSLHFFHLLWSAQSELRPADGITSYSIATFQNGSNQCCILYSTIFVKIRESRYSKDFCQASARYTQLAFVVAIYFQYRMVKKPQMIIKRNT